MDKKFRPVKSKMRPVLKEDNIPNLLSRSGISKEKVEKMSETIDDLLSFDPSMVAAKSIKNNILIIEGKPTKFKKNATYIMAFDTFLSARKNKNTGEILFKPSDKKFKTLFKRYSGENLDNKTLFTWRTGGIGDLMFSQPIMKYLKEKYPTCKITYASALRNLSLFENWPTNLIDNTSILPFSAHKLFSSDYHLTYEGSVESCKEAHVLNAYDVFKKVAGLDFDVNDYPPELIGNPELEKELRQYIPKNIIICQMKATSPLRMLATSQWEEIINEIQSLGYNVGFLDSSHREDRYNKFIDEFNINKDKTFNLCKYSTNLSRAVSIVNVSDGVVGIDSSLIHIGAALKKPVLGIYGPFDADLRMRYYKTGRWVQPEEYTECGKFRCFYHQNQIKNCPFIRQGRPVGCLSSITTERILDEFKLVMGV